jgi:TM2 domain-containing membrane protein YozV
MLEKVQEREPGLSWWERSIPKVHKLYRLHYPDGKLIWIHYCGILGAVSILIAFLFVLAGIVHATTI